jgi:hypothetical protein
VVRRQAWLYDHQIDWPADSGARGFASRDAA